MATLAEAEVLRSELSDLATMAQSDINGIFHQIVTGLDLDPDQARDILTDVVPSMLDPYAANAAAITQDFYYADRRAQGVTTPYHGNPAPVLPAKAQYTSLVGKGTSLLLQNPELLFTAGALLAGGAQRLLFNASRETTFHLADKDPVVTRYQRMTTSAEPCEFCIMLASRGAVYRSSESNDRVVGRGVPLGTVKGHLVRPGDKVAGARGGGVKPRGPRSIGERFHDNDKCISVAVHENNSQELTDAATEYYEMYAAARAKLYDERPRTLQWRKVQLKGGEEVRRHYWTDDANEIVTSQDQTRRLLAEMRKIRNNT